MKPLGLRFSPLGFLAFLTVLSWGVFALAAAVLGEIHVLSLVAAVMTTGVLIAWPIMVGKQEGGAAPLQMTSCRDCGRMVRAGESFGFCLRCGSMRTVKGTLFGPRI